MAKKVAVIIPHYGPEIDLKRCLWSLKRLANNIITKTVVVHSGPEPLRSSYAIYGPKTILISTDERLFAGSARNLGAAAAKECELLFFLDSDCIVAPGWLDAHMEVHGNNIGVAAGRVLPAPYEKPKGLAEYLIEFAVTRHLPPNGEFMSLPACNFSINRDLFQKSGGFPDDPAGQDLHFNLKLRSIGENITFVKSAVVYHYCRSSPDDFRENRRRMGRGLGSVTFLAEKKGLLGKSVCAEYRFLVWICRSPFGLLLIPAKLFRLCYLILKGDYAILAYIISSPASLITGLWIEGRYCRKGYIEEASRNND